MKNLSITDLNEYMEIIVQFDYQKFEYIDIELGVHMVPTDRIKKCFAGTLTSIDEAKKEICVIGDVYTDKIIGIDRQDIYTIEFKDIIGIVENVG